MAKDYNKPLTAAELKRLQKKQKPSSPNYDYFGKDNHGPV